MGNQLVLVSAKLSPLAGGVGQPELALASTCTGHGGGRV